MESFTLADYSASSPEKDPKKLIEGYRGAVQVGLLSEGQYDDEIMADVDNQLLQHAKDSGIDLQGFDSAQEDDTSLVARHALDTNEPEVATAANRLRALRDPSIRDSYADRPDEYAAKLEEAQIGYDAAAPLEKRQAARRAALNRGDIPFATFQDKEGNHRVELGAEILGLAGDDKALAEVFKANPNLDRNLIPHVRQKLQTPEGFNVPLAQIERQQDFSAAFDEVAPTLNYQLDGIKRAIAQGKMDNLDVSLKDIDMALSGTPLAEQFTPEERKAFVVDYATRTAPIELDPEAPEKNLRTLSTGEVHIPTPVMMNKQIFDRVLPSLPEAQRPMAEAQREQVVNAYAKGAFKTITARRPEFADEYAEQKAAGKTDTEILDTWTADPKNQSTAYEYLSGITESIPGALVTAAAALPALGGSKTAASLIRHFDTQTQQRKEFANLVGKDLGVGYDIGTMIAPVVVDIFATKGAAAVARGTVGAAARAAVKPVVRGFFGATVQEGTKGLVNSFVKGSVRRELEREGLGAVGDVALKPTQVLSAIGRDIEQGLARAEFSTGMFVSGFNRSAGASYVQTYSTLEGLKNPDGSRKFSDEQVRDMAVKHATTVGTMTGLTTLGFNAFGAAGLERIFDGGLTRKQLGGVFSRLKKDWGNMAPAVREGIDMTNADTMLASMMTKSIKPLWKVGVQGAAEEFPEEATQNFLEDIANSYTTGEKFDAVQSIKGALYAGMLGGVMGGGATVTADVVSSPEVDARREAAVRRNALLTTAAKLDANPNLKATADAVRQLALEGIPQSEAPQEDVPEGVPAAGDESAPSRPAVAGAPEAGSLTPTTNGGTDPAGDSAQGVSTPAGEAVDGSAPEGGTDAPAQPTPEQVAAHRDARRQEIVAEWGSKRTKSGLKPGTPAEVREELETIETEARTSEAAETPETIAPVEETADASSDTGEVTRDPNTHRRHQTPSEFKSAFSYEQALLRAKSDPSGKKAKALKKEGKAKYEARVTPMLEGDHREEIKQGFAQNEAVSAEAVDTYGIKLPEGYAREGDLYVYAPEQSSAPTTPQGPVASNNPPKPSVVAPDGSVKGVPADKLTTPLMKSWVDLNNAAPEGAIVMVRLGDFYEVFGEDAKIAAKLMEVALTKRNGIPMAGIPYHAKDSYLKKLTDAGQVVALAEMQGPVTRSGNGKRGIAEVMTPTVTAETAPATPAAAAQGAKSQPSVGPKVGDPITFTSSVPGTQTPTQGVIAAIDAKGRITAQVGKTKYPNARVVAQDQTQITNIEAVLAAADLDPTPAERLVTDALTDPDVPELTVAETQGGEAALDEVINDAAPEIVTDGMPVQLKVELVQGGVSENVNTLTAAEGDPTAQSIAAVRNTLQQQGKTFTAKNKYTPENSPVAKELAQFGGTEDINAFLTRVAKNGEPEHRELAKILLRFPDVLVTPVHLQDAPFAGTYVPQTGQILINTARPGPRGGVDTVLHELVHAATHAAIKNPTPEQALVLKRIDGIRRNVQKRAAKAGRTDLAYGLGSNDEFFTHLLTSPAFQREVAAMTPKGERNWVEVLIDAVRDLLGMAKVPSGVLKDMIEFTQSAADLKYGRHAMTTDGRVLMLPAHHGTPHKVDKFSTDFMGTGEGAQAYGWGLYFAGDESIGRYYRDTLSSRISEKADLRVGGEVWSTEDVINNFTFEDDKILREVAKWMTDEVTYGRPADLEQAIKAARDGSRLDKNPAKTARIDALLAKGVSAVVLPSKGGGNLYTVEILADEDEMLDWDKPLSEQSEKVRDAITKSFFDYLDSPEYAALPWGKSSIPREERMKEVLRMKGEEHYKSLTNSRFSNDEKSSAYLHSLGIKGVKFLDGNSRFIPTQVKAAEKSVASWKASVEAGTPGAKDQLQYAERHLAEMLDKNQSHNYVIFDGKDIVITHENGVPVTPEQATAPDPGPYGTARMDALMQMPEGEVRDSVRFHELTRDLGESPTQADIDSFKTKQPGAYAELKAMRERVLTDKGLVYLGLPDAYFKNQTHTLGDLELMEEADRLSPKEMSDLTASITRYGLTGDTAVSKGPIVVFPNDVGTFDVEDGNHRITIAKEVLNLPSNTPVDTLTYVGDAEPLNLSPEGKLIPPSQWGDAASPSILFQPSEDADASPLFRKYSDTMADNGVRPKHMVPASEHYRVGEYWSLGVNVPIKELAGVRANAISKARTKDIQRAREQGVELPPIELAVWRKGGTEVIDGNHRLVDARNSGAESVFVKFTFPDKDLEGTNPSTDTPLFQPSELLTASHDAGTAALSDPTEAETAVLREFHELTTTGNVSARQRAGYRVDKTALDRLVTYLRAAIKELATSLKRSFNMTSAVHLDRLGRELAAAEDGYKVRSRVKAFDPDAPVAPLFQMSADSAPAEFTETNYTEVNVGNELYESTDEELKKAGWFKRMFARRNDLLPAQAAIKVGHDAMVNATAYQVGVKTGNYNRAIKKESPNMDDVRKMAGSTAPMLTPEEEIRLDAEYQARLDAAHAGTDLGEIEAKATRDKTIRDAQSTHDAAMLSADPGERAEAVANYGQAVKDAEAEYRRASQAAKEAAEIEDPGVTAAKGIAETKRENARKQRDLAQEQVKQDYDDEVQSPDEATRVAARGKYEARLKQIKSGHDRTIAEITKERDKAISLRSPEAREVQAMDEANEWLRNAKEQSMLDQADKLRTEQDAAAERLARTSPQTHAAVLSLRKTLDEFQAKLAKANKSSKPGLSLMIDRSNGLYLVRSYEFYRDPQRREKIMNDPLYADLKERLVDLFGKEFARDALAVLKADPANANRPDADLEAQARNNVRDLSLAKFEDYLLSRDGPAKMGNYAEGVRMEVERFMKKNNQDPLIAEMLGEIEDPLFNLSNTIESVSHLLFMHRQNTSLAKDGQAAGYLVNEAQMKADPTKYRGWVPLVSNNPDAPAFAPLGGLYATAEHKKAFDAAFGTGHKQALNTANEALSVGKKLIMGAAGKSMATMILGNPASYVRNLFGNPFVAASQGVNPFSKKGLKSAMETINMVRGQGKGDQAFIEKMIAYRILGDGAKIEFMREFLTKYKESPTGAAAWVAERGEKLSPDAMEKLRKGKGAWDKLTDILGRSSEFTETFLGPLVFLNELEVHLKAGFSQIDAEQEAARIAKKVLPGKSERSQAVTEFGKSGVATLMAPFLGFKSEMIRSVIGTWQVALEHSVSDNPVLAAHGRRRISASFAIQGGVVTLLPILLRSLAKVDDEEDQLFRAALPSYAKNSNFWYFRGADGSISTWDMTFAIPYSITHDWTTQTFLALHAAATSNPERLNDVPLIFGRLFGEELVGEQIVAGKVLDVMRNKDDTSGNEIWRRDEALVSKMYKQAEHVIGGAYIPAGAKKVDQLIKSANRPDKEDEPFWYTPLGITTATVAPFKPRSHETEKFVTRALREVTTDSRQQWTITSKLTSPQAMAPGEATRIIKERNDAHLKNSTRAYRFMQAAKGFGMTPRQVMLAAKEADMSQERAQLALQGYANSKPLPAETLRKIKEIDPKRYAEVVRAMRQQPSRVNLRDR